MKEFSNSSDTDSDSSFNNLKYTSRRLIVCLDGTDDEPDEDQTNLCRFFHMLKHNKEQIPYYQTGIGTPIKCRIGDESKCAGRKHIGVLTRIVDKAFATSLSEHIRSAYTFLMDHYQEGDKIYIFGFSRGAYAARALAGMIHKIGMLPPERHDLLEQAYDNYRKADDLQGWKSSLSFKRRHSVVEHVEIEFLGVWDTVSSVGIFPRHLPFTSYNTAIHYIRHAVSLDEHRSKFEPLLYRDEDFAAASEEMKEEIKEGKDAELKAGYVNHGGMTNLKEVWFAGGHCDVGGGAVLNTTRHSLARISLRWMVHECFRTGSGIQFKPKKLQPVGLELSKLTSSTKSTPRQSIVKNLSSALEDIADLNARRNARLLTEEEEELRDALCPIHDRLEEQKLWKLPEIMTGWHFQPGRYTGLPILVPHLEAGRAVPNQRKVDLLVHRSVKLRMDAGSSILRNSQFQYLQGYQPKVNFEVEPIWVD